MTEFGVALGMIAPYYNLVLVLVTIWLFIKLLKTPIQNKLVDLRPWILIFIALLVYVVEEIITVFRALGLINIPIHINGFFELAIISIFIYTLLLQKHCIKQALCAQKQAPEKKAPEKKPAKKKAKK